MAAHSPVRENLIGVWKIRSMETKGLTMMHEQVGMPYIEFTEKNSFMVKFSTSHEIGRFKVSGNTIILNFKLPVKPSQQLIITKLDKTELDYTTIQNTDTMHVKAFRITTGFDADSDKDKDKEKEEEREREKKHKD
jgi:hypothetical protein